MSELTTSAIRMPLDNFPDVIIHAPETAVKKHPRYKDAKAGDSDAAIIPGQGYVLVDDFVGMGGTLANMRGYIKAQGGVVIAAVACRGGSIDG